MIGLKGEVGFPGPQGPPGTNGFLGVRGETGETSKGDFGDDGEEFFYAYRVTFVRLSVCVLVCACVPFLSGA